MPEEMGRCISCQFWVRQRIQGLAGFGICSRSMASNNRPVLVHVKFMAADNDGFGAWMLSHEEFGCIEFTKRPAPLFQMPTRREGKY
jgi:hypothetical protein